MTTDYFFQSYYTTAAKDLARIRPIAQDWLVKNINLEDWPEDDWYTMDENWDLNVWLWPDDAPANDRDSQKAALYYVVDGSPIVDFAFHIQHPFANPRRRKSDNPPTIPEIYENPT